jgi:hydroxymethylpyrimidine pyrophosphatase-like HAD family hydrolase
MPRPGLPKLIATDLDGTLVRGDDTVSEFTHQVLDRVRAAGIPIVGATGRGPRLTELTRNDIRAADYLVMAGGGRVIDQSDPAGPGPSA